MLRRRRFRAPHRRNYDQALTRAKAQFQLNIHTGREYAPRVVQHEVIAAGYEFDQCVRWNR